MCTYHEPSEHFNPSGTTVLPPKGIADGTAKVADSIAGIVVSACACIADVVGSIVEGIPSVVSPVSGGVDIWGWHSVVQGALPSVADAAAGAVLPLPITAAIHGGHSSARGGVTGGGTAQRTAHFRRRQSLLSFWNQSCEGTQSRMRDAKAIGSAKAGARWFGLGAHLPSL